MVAESVADLKSFVSRTVDESFDKFLDLNSEKTIPDSVLIRIENLGDADLPCEKFQVNGQILPMGQTLTNGVTNIGAGVGPNLLFCIQYAYQKIHMNTLGAVKPSMLSMVINPTLAGLISRSLEIQNYLKGSPYALSQVRMDTPSRNGHCGLPDVLYGVNVFIEDHVSFDKKYVLDNCLAIMMPTADIYTVDSNPSRFYRITKDASVVLTHCI